MDAICLYCLLYVNDIGVSPVSSEANLWRITVYSPCCLVALHRPSLAASCIPCLPGYTI